MSDTQTWIDLSDKESGAKLKLDSFPGSSDQFLFITSMSNKAPKWSRAIKELNFRESSNRNFLLKKIKSTDRIKVSDYQSIWPGAKYGQIPKEQVGINLPGQYKVTEQRSAKDREIANELSNAKFLGRNLQGESVYEDGQGRFTHSASNTISRELDSSKSSLYLRAPNEKSLDECADGFVRSLLLSEVLRSEDLDRFVQAVYEVDAATPDQMEKSFEVIDAAITRNLVQSYETANDAFGDSVRMYEYMPMYPGKNRGNGAMPIPLAAIAQRLLGNTTGKTVVVPNAFDGASFAFLPKDTNIRAFKGKKDISNRAEYLARSGLEWGQEFHPAKDANADALLFNADMSRSTDGTRTDYKNALLSVRSTAPNARAVLVLEGDDPFQPGVVSQESRIFLESLYARYDVEGVFEVAREMTKTVGSKSTLRVISLKNRDPQAGENGEVSAPPKSIPVVHSWDEAKAFVDEALSKAAIKEVEADGISVSGVIEDNVLQRPYIAFSSIGEARSMVPKELQQPLRAFMSDLESTYGPVDEFVAKELGFAGVDTLVTRFSPEQVDAMGTIFHAMKRGRGHILGDETGIGKGRTLAGLTTWALKQERTVVFITDRANLFSDLARDLRDIGEWGRVRPFIMNSDGKIEDIIGEAGVLAEGVKPAEMRRILKDNVDIEKTGCNVIFTTYSQISGEDSEKSVWLKNQLKDALLIVDEAHVAAGSDSNISTQITEMTSIAWNVEFSSATWAKSAKNMQIYARAFPESVNIGSLSKTMKRGGETFLETFSGMLARTGALTRREFDLSKLEFVVEIDNNNSDRNNAVSDRIAEIMSALAFTAGSLKRIVTRMSDINIAALRDARDVRSSAQSAQIFKSRFGTGGMLYQVNRRVNVALNVDNAVRLALEGIAAGRKPVIVFEDTGETFVRQAIETQAVTMPDGSRQLPEFLEPPTIKDLLRRIVETLQMVRVEEVSAEDLPALDLNAEMNEAINIFDGEDATNAAPEVAPADLEAPQPQQLNAVEPTATDPNDEQLVATEGVPGADPVTPGNAIATPARAARVVPVDEGILVEEVARARDGTEGEETTPGRRTKAVKRKTKLVPFWELQAVSEASRKSFEDGLNEINRLIDSLPSIPLNAPDEIARRLGESITTAGDKIRVGELSGRSFSLQRQSDMPGNLHKIVPRPKSKSYVTATVRGFNSGDIDVLMINRSAATGISIHSSPRFADRRRRQLIEVQIPENPTDRFQLFGRVNRYDQVSFPLIQIASTGIYGEVRQMMVQNKKASEMSASVRSSRESHVIVDGIRDLLNPVGRDVCRAYLDDNSEILTRLDLTTNDVSVNSSRDIASVLTSRIPLLRHVEQKQAYAQLYAMFDDAIVQAELSGSNPLKPNELDVRAKVGNPRLLFGFDHKGLGCAFDGPVFAQRIDWTEDVRPMALESIVEIVKTNRAKLVKLNKAKSIGETSKGTLQIDIGDLGKRAAAQLEGRARLAVAGTDFKSSEEAMRSVQPNPVRKGMARAAWMRENMHKLIPGRIVSMKKGETEKKGDRSFFNRRNAVILDITPPADKRESQLAEWRVLTIGPGEAKPISTTLNALIGQLYTDAIEFGSDGQEITRRRGSSTPVLGETVVMSAISHLEIGSDIIDLYEAENAEERRGIGQAWIYRSFEERYVGLRKRSALALTGNMYLASEWAAQTKAGNSAIFTDDRGARHRGIILKDTFKPEWLKFLPTRLWMPKMIDNFVDHINSGEMALNSDGMYKMYSTFDGAWKSTEGGDSLKHTDFLVVTPGVGLAMHVGKESKKRINSMLRQAQKTIKEEVYGDVKVRPQDDPGHVTISETKKRATQLATTGRPGRGRRVEADDVATSARGQGDLIILAADTPEKLKRAFKMLMRGPGLEIFVPPPIGTTPPDISRVAKECMREYYVERLREDNQGDPAKLAKLEELLLDESQPNSRAVEMEEELKGIQSMEGQRQEKQEYEPDLFDFNGHPIPNLSDEPVSNPTTAFNREYAREGA